MRKNVIIGLIASALLVFSTTASALEISLSFNPGSSGIANPVSGTATDLVIDLTPGDVIAFDVTVGNAPADVLTAVFASVAFDSTQVSFLGGAFNNILTEMGCVGFLCSPATLAPGIPSPILKPNSPAAFGTGTEAWVQAVAHTNVAGSAGQGPDVALLMAFQYTGVGGFDFVNLVATLTAGDAIGGTVTGPISFSGATINVPEPGTALLMGLGLFGLGAAGRRKN